MKYKIIATGEVFPTNELQARFPNVSFAPTLDQVVLDYFGLAVVPDDAADIAAALDRAKASMNLKINVWRAQANQTSFTHLGNEIACDALSRSDIDAVAGSVALTGVFPVGFPHAWKAMDNSYLPLPDVAAFKAMYASMAQQGTVNFGRSQTLKAAVVAATSIEQITAITWS